MSDINQDLVFINQVLILQFSEAILQFAAMFLQYVPFRLRFSRLDTKQRLLSVTRQRLHHVLPEQILAKDNKTHYFCIRKNSTRDIRKMDKQEIYNILKSHGIAYEVTEHGKVYNMEEMDALELPHKEVLAKNLFVHDDKKQNYYLITVKGKRRINLKDFRSTYGTRRLSFANGDEMKALLGTTPGSVSPFGLLNDTDCRVKFFIDKDFMGGMIGVHPNENTSTVWMQTADLMSIIEEHGNEMKVMQSSNR